MRLEAQDDGTFDLAFIPGQGIVMEDGLQTAVIISLLCDHRANADDRLPDERDTGGVIPPDRRGWCGDALADTVDDRIGSRIWLLVREKQIEPTRQAAISYANEALEWMIDDSVATAVNTDASFPVMGRIDLSADISLPAGGTFASVIRAGGA